MFHCTLTLYFKPQDRVDPLQARGSAPSKKESKKIALKKMVQDVIYQGYLRFGFKERKYLDQVCNI